MKARHSLLLLLALIALAACRPSLDSYTTAYDSVVARRDSLAKLEETIYGKYRRDAQQRRVALGADTLNVVTEYIGYTEDGGASRESVDRYNVVVGRFKQVFNARQMRERIQGRGYPEAFIVHTREPLYYVVAGTYPTAQEALEMMHHVSEDTVFVLRDPLPFVLMPAHMAR